MTNINDDLIVRAIDRSWKLAHETNSAKDWEAIEQRLYGMWLMALQLSDTAAFETIDFLEEIALQHRWNAKGYTGRAV